MAHQTLALIWYFIIIFGVIMYVILDGFTIGTAIIMPFLEDKEKDIAMSVILPTWDGNQTWLVLGGAAMYGTFPLAFSIVLPALYFPIYIMILALLFRGVCFEFRLKAKEEKPRWDMLFFISSIIIAFIQGVILAKFVGGFNLDHGHISLNQDSLTSFFSIFVGFGLIIGYLLLGCTRLILKTEGELQIKLFRFAKIITFIGFLFMIGVSIWTPFIDTKLKDFWFNTDNMKFLALLPLVTILIFATLVWSLYKNNDIKPYWCTVGIFLCGYIGFILGTFPYIVPHTITLYDAASPTSSLIFTLVGAVIMLPILLFYTWYSYRIFRGKVNEVIKY